MKLELTVEDIERIADNLVDKNTIMIDYETFINNVENCKNFELKSTKVEETITLKVIAKKISEFMK